MHPTQAILYDHFHGLPNWHSRDRLFIRRPSPDQPNDFYIWCHNSYIEYWSEPSNNGGYIQVADPDCVKKVLKVAGIL